LVPLKYNYHVLLLLAKPH